MKIGDNEVIVLSSDRVRVGCQEFTKQEVLAIVGLLNNCTPKFAVGDFVKVNPYFVTNIWQVETNYKSAPEFLGRYGRVIKNNSVGLYKDAIAVEFAAPQAFGHTCEGSTKHGHGYYFLPEMLERVE